MALMRIRLELARSPEFPNGSSHHGYSFIAPLTDDGRLDTAEWRDHKPACTVHRFWRGEPSQDGHLVHLGQGWRFHYEGDDLDEDEPLYKLDRHTIREGEYLSITEDDELRTFRVTQIVPAT